MSSYEDRIGAWRTALPDWEKRLKEGRTLIPDLPLFEDQAEKALRIFKRLRVPDIEGNPTHGEVCGEWVFELVRAVFGSYDAKTKRRMISEFFLLIPKKNGKSSVAAAIIVTAAIMNARPQAELLLIAPTKKIADIAFKQAMGIIRLDKDLSTIFHPTHHQRTITHLRTRAEILIKAADTDAITGSKSTFILIDETHEFASKTKAKEVFIEVRGALAARPDGFLMQITTQSKSEPSGVFKDELQTARDVRDGKVVLPVLAILYEFPEEMEKAGAWREEKNWHLVNPNYGKSVDPVFLRNQFIKAEREGPASVALLASQHLNVQIGLGYRTDSWVVLKYWREKGRVEKLSREELIERSEVVVPGIDGGGLDDLLGLTLLGREKGTKKWLVWCRAWVHQIVEERRKEIWPRLLDFAKDGDLVIIDNESNEDVVQVCDIIEEVRDAGKLAKGKAIAVDSVGITDILDELELRKFDLEARVEPVSQGWRMSDKIKTFERRVSGAQLIHADQPLMDWCMNNVKVEVRGNAVSITKAVSGTAKIDPVISALNAAHIMAKNPVADPGSVYTADRGLLMFG